MCVCGVSGLGPRPWLKHFIPRGRGAGLAGEPRLRSTCCPAPLPPNISGRLDFRFRGFALPTPPPVGSSQRDILGGLGGWGSSFLCVYVVNLTVLPPPHWPVPISSYLYGTSNKDTHFRLGPTTPAFHCFPGPAPGTGCLLLPLLSRGLLSHEVGSGQRRHLGGGGYFGELVTSLWKVPGLGVQWIETILVPQELLRQKEAGWRDGWKGWALGANVGGSGLIS